MMRKKDLMKKIENSDVDKVKLYLELLDRMLLNVLVKQLMGEEEVSSVIKHWQREIRRGINIESVARSELLMGTDIGRLLANSELEDGEELRLKSLEAMVLASEIVNFNYPTSEENL